MNEPSVPAPGEPKAPLPEVATDHPLVSQPKNLWERLKQHKVVEWTLAYVAFGYALVHGVEMVRDAFEWPTFIPRFTIVALTLGLPVAVTLAWYHGHRAERRIGPAEWAILIALLASTGTALWVFSGRGHEHTAPVAVQTTATSMPRPGPSGTAPAFAPAAHSVAVLPFANLSGDPNQEYFSDGVSEELLNALSRIDALQVAARTSSFAFKGKDVDIETIARQLNVAAVLEGSVRRSGNTVRVAVQLISAVNGFHLWSQSYDRELKDILAVQTDVATAVAQQLQVKLLGDEAARIEIGGTHNPKAYESYLRGMRLLAGQGNATEGLAAALAGSENARAALTAFDEAIEFDSNYAAAHALRSTALLSLSEFTGDPGQRGVLRQQARQSAERAYSLAPDFGEARLALGDVRVAAFDFAGAASQYDRALALAPGSARIQRNFAWFAGSMGHFDAAIAAAHRAVTLDPQNYYSHLAVVQVLSFAGRFNEALAAAEAGLAVNPGGQEVRFLLGLTYLAAGHPERALQACASTITPHDAGAEHRCLALAYHALHNQREAELEMDKFKAITTNAAPFLYAGVYAQWGKHAEALHWLDVAEQSRDSNLQFLRVFWTLSPIRNEPEFKALERRLNFPP